MIHPVEEFLFYSNAKFSLPIILSIYHQLNSIFQQRQQGYITVADITQTVGYCGKGLSTQEIETYTTLFQEICFTACDDGNGGQLLQMKGEFNTSNDMVLLNNLVPYIQQHCRGKYTLASITTLQKEIDQHLVGGGVPPTMSTGYANPRGAPYRGGPKYSTNPVTQYTYSNVGHHASSYTQPHNPYAGHQGYQSHSPYQQPPQPQYQRAQTSANASFTPQFQQSIRQAVLSTSGTYTPQPQPQPLSQPQQSSPPQSYSQSSLSLPYTPNPQVTAATLSAPVANVGTGSYYPSSNPSLPYYQPSLSQPAPPQPPAPHAYQQPVGPPLSSPTTNMPYGAPGGQKRNIATSFYRPNHLQQTQHLAPPSAGVPYPPQPQQQHLPYGGPASAPAYPPATPYGNNAAVKAPSARSVAPVLTVPPQAAYSPSKASYLANDTAAYPGTNDTASYYHSNYEFLNQGDSAPQSYYPPSASHSGGPNSVKSNSPPGSIYGGDKDMDMFEEESIHSAWTSAESSSASAFGSSVASTTIQPIELIDSVATFLTTLRQRGLEVIFPQSLQDEVS